MPPLNSTESADARDARDNNKNQVEKSKRSSCPYAEMSESSKLVQNCPAFSSECPFKVAKSPKEISERLAQVPESHLKTHGAFFQTLQVFHQGQSGGEGLCPVKHALHHQAADWTFDRAMDDYSLAVIMSRLAESYEEQDEQPDETEYDGGITAASTAFETNKPRASPRLSDALKTGTASAHAAAESVHFVKNFIRGKIDRDLYALYVAQLYHLYTRLEEALDVHAPRLFPQVHFPNELYRRSALEEDVHFWHSRPPRVSPATQDYIDRLEYLQEHAPHLLLAHAYTRYLGDLSGGKILERVARRALGLSEGDGLAFYAFPNVPSFKLFKDMYRSQLNALDMVGSVQELVQEANVAFLLNMRLFEELDVLGGVPGATLRPLESVYVQRNSAVDSKHDEECPFLKNRNQQTPKGQCPWPFLLLHDPKKGLQAWQSWLIIGLLLAWLHSTWQ